MKLYAYTRQDFFRSPNLLNEDGSDNAPGSLSLAYATIVIHLADANIEWIHIDGKRYERDSRYDIELSRA